MSVLVIAPHADDETLSMGGTIAKYLKNKIEVHIAILTGPSDNKAYNHPFLDENYLKIIRNESKLALKTLGVKNIHYFNHPPVLLADKPTWEINKIIGDLIEEIKPSEVFIPFSYDLHSDHKKISYAVNVALRPYLDKAFSTRKIIAYETLSETDLEFLAPRFSPNIFVDISNTISIKLKAMSCYKSQVHEKFKPRSLESIKALASLRGSHIGCKAAESFMLIGEYIR